MMKSIVWRTSRRAVCSRNIVSRSSSSTTTSNQDGVSLQGLSPIVLRDACKCSRCIDQSTKQREFIFSDIPTNIEASWQQDSEKHWSVRWKNDLPGYEDHVSRFTEAQIRRIRRHPRKDYRARTVLWDKLMYEKERLPVEYDSFMNEEAGLAKVLWLFRKYGLVFLTKVPSEPESVSRIAERIAPLRNTFYGNTWNVRSVPQAKNVAYTSKYLGFHMDLLYMKESPGAQFLHCLENNSTGGESQFLDTFKAYDVLQSENPEHAELLKKTKIRYEYDNDGYYYTDTKPIVQVTTHADTPFRMVENSRLKSSPQSAEVSRVYWSPPFVGSILTLPTETQVQSLKKVEAARSFAEILKRDDLIYETKMDEGTCVMFDNLRVVHARNAFDMNSGKRWLRGCYLDSQDVASKELSLKDRITELESNS